MALVRGLTGSLSMTVSPDDTADEIGTSSVRTLATSNLLALCEKATQAAVAEHLSPGIATIGVQVRLDHVTPSPIGCHVSAQARLDKVVGKKLHFTISAYDDRGLIAAGKLTRVMVDEQDFMAKCEG